MGLASLDLDSSAVIAEECAWFELKWVGFFDSLISFRKVRRLRMAFCWLGGWAG